MRTLRSGKPLPDTPPVMRGSRGGITAAVNKSSLSQAQNNIATVVDNPTTAPTTISSEKEEPDNVTSTPVTPETITTCNEAHASNEEVIESESPSLLIKRGRGRPPKVSRKSFQPTTTAAKVGAIFARKSEPPRLPALRRRTLSLTMESEVKIENEDENGVSDGITDPPKDEAIKVDVDDDLGKEADAIVKVDDTEHVIQPQEMEIKEEIVVEAVQKSPVAVPTTPVAVPTTPVAAPTTPTTELRRSLRCPKRKPAVIVQATMAVERDSLPFLESCNICGEEFNRKSLLQRHYKTHKTPEPKKSEAKSKGDVSNLSSGPFEEHEGDYDQEYEDVEDGEDQKPAFIDFTKKRPSQSSMTMKDAITCDVCTMTFTRRAHLNRHMLLHTGIKPFTCPVCNLSFTRKDHMLAHKTKHDKEHKIQCAQCGMGFVTWQILQDHIKNVHSTFKPAVPGRPKAVIQNHNPENACDICGKKFLQRRYLRAHRKLHLRKEASILAQLRLVEQQHFNVDDESYENMDDGEMYDEDEDMDFDENILNPEVRIDYESSSPIKNRTEENLSHDDGSTSSSKSHITRSLVSMNRVVKLAESSGSDAGSPDSSVMSVEEANLDKDELDDLIDYDYKAMMQLKSGSFNEGDVGDEDEELPNQPMECSVCGKEFDDRAELRKHYRIHKKRFICRFCGLKLASAGSLMRHNLIHTGKKEFSCKLCTRRFSRKDTLMVHLQAHEKSSTRINMPKPFLCKVCHAGYTMKYNLIRHIKMCHGNITSANRAAILKQIEQKYKDGIPSTSVEDSQSNSPGHAFTKTNSSPLEIKSEPLDNEVYCNEEFNPILTDDEMEQDQGQPLNDEELGEQLSGEGDGHFICNHCGKVFKNAKSLNTHKWYHSRDKQFICPICNRGFKYSTDLGRHINTHGNDGTKGTSPATFVPTTHHSAMNGHQDQAPPSYTNGIRGPRIRHVQQYGGRLINSLDTRPFGCKLCPQRFNHRSNLSRHVRLIHKATNPRKRGSSVNLQNYLMKLQPNSNGQHMNMQVQRLQSASTSAYQGPQRTSASIVNRSARIDTMDLGVPNQLDSESRRNSVGSTVLTPDSFTYDPTSDRPYICSTCGKSFESKNNLWTHCRIHNKIFGCQFCNLKMATRGDLVLHLRTHTGEKPFGCHLCEWRFSRKSGLNKHLEKYHGPGGKQLRVFKFGQSYGMSTQSQHSGMEISTISAMSQQRSQAGGTMKSVLFNRGTGLTITRTPIGSTTSTISDSRYSCRLCNNILVGKVQYIRHMNAHSKSTNQNDLTVHQAMAAVSAIEPTDQFICKECGHEFESQELLTKHILTHSDSDAARCTLCGKSCSSLGLLKRHYQNAHPGYPNPAEIVSVHSENASNSDLKPTVVRTVRRDENGQEESDEEFPNESEDPPNMIKPGLVKPGSGPIVEVDVDNLDEDELVYAAVNPRHQVGRKIAEIPMSSKQAKLHCCPFAQCNRDFKVRSDLQKHLRRHASELPHKCRICTARFPHKQDAHRHMKSIHNFACKSRAFPCDFCDQHFPAEIELENHMQTLHGVTLAEVFDEGNDEEYPEQDDYNNELDYEEAILDHHRSNAADPEDDEILDPTSFLEQSMGEASEKTDYHCGLCNKNFPTRQKWLYHRYYHVREEKYDCPNCDEKFKLRSHLERHIRTYHNDEKPVYNILTCDRCPRKFTREYDLTTHIQKVHLQIPPPSLIQKPRLSAPLPITMTMTKNRNPVSILKSSIISQPKPTSSSSVASNQFPKVGALVRKSWPPLPPTKPTATITSSSVQSRPEPIESTMRLGPDGWYTCNLCGKSFKEKKSIDAHRYYHNREEKHLCTHCTGRFKQKSDLQRHIRIHHNSMNPKNTIHCPHCYRSFTDIRYMRMHIRRYHGENGSDNPQSYSRQGNASIDFDEMEERHIMGEEVDDEMEWYTSPEEYLNEDDDDQKEMQTMEEMEYLQYKNETESGGEMQLTISCECGVEVEAKDIADHVCSSLEEESSQEQGQEFLKLKGNKSTEYEPESQSLESSPIPNDKQIESEGMAENSESTETICKLSEAETVQHTSEPTIEGAQPPKQLAIDQDSSTEVVITDQQSTKNIEN